MAKADYAECPQLETMRGGVMLALGLAFRKTLGVLSVAALCCPAFSAPIVFFGLDSNPVDPLPLLVHPNADAARASFLNQLAPATGIQGFEASAAPLTFLPLGSTATLSGPATFATGNHPGGLFPISGAGYLQSFVLANTPRTLFTLTFDTPVQAIGFYGVDFSDFFGLPDPGGSLQVVLAGLGASQVLDALPGMNPVNIASGAVHFWGVISADQPFSSVSLVAPAGALWLDEGVAIDDLLVGTPALVSAPSSLTLLSLALALIGCQRVRTRQPTVTEA